MIRQTGMAVGVAVLVALLASSGPAAERVASFQRAWWAMAGITALGLLPTLLIRPKR
jgi:hypothetical protein